MNKNLGRFLLLYLLFWHVEIFASNYVWHVEVNKKSAVVNEAIYLKYSCDFDDRAELYSIEFNPVGENERYKLEPLSQNTKITDGKKSVIYEFVAFAKNAGEIRFEFDTLMKKTNRDSVENTVIGRDNMQKEEFSATALRQESVVVQVSENRSGLFGSLDFRVKKESPKVKAFEPYHMELTLEGVGNFELLKPFEFTIQGVKVFAQKPIENSTLTQDGLRGMWSQKFAFVSEKDFEIPAISFEYFDKTEQKIKELRLEATKVEVAQAFSKEELLDEDEKKESFLKLEYLYYLLTFIAGFLASKIKIKKNIPHAKEQEFLDKVESVKSLDALCMLLALKNAQKFTHVIAQIEKKEIQSLKEAKKAVVSLIEY